MPKGITLTNATKGVRPSIADKIFEAFGEETPFYTRVAKGGPQSNYTDQHPADTPGEAREGGEPDNEPAKPPINQSKNYDLIETNAELWKHSVRVGLLAGYFTDRAGVVPEGSKPEPKLLSREVTKSLRALHVVIDRELCSSRDQRDPTDTLGMQTRGVGSWISATAQKTRPVPEIFRPDAEQIYNGNWDNFDLDALEDVLEAAYSKTGFSGVYDAYCGIQFKRRCTNFSVEQKTSTGAEAIRRFVEDPTKEKITRSINVLELDSGTVELIRSRNLNFTKYGNLEKQTDLSKRTCYLIPQGPIAQSGGFELLTTQKPVVQDLPNDGGGTSKQIIAIFGLRGNPTGCAKITPAA